VEKAITTALFVIASVAAALAIINGVMPAVGRSSSALAVANAEASARIKTDHEIIFAVGDTSSAVLTLWVKNVGSETIDSIGQADLILTQPDNTTKRVSYSSSSPCTPECWEYQFEDSATKWSKGVTIKITVRLNTVATGVWNATFTLRNGVTAKKEFSV